MKPKKKAGAPGSAGKSAREAVSKSKSIDLSLLPHTTDSKRVNKKEGRGRERSYWETDFEEGNEIAHEKMKGAEYENLSQDGIRKQPKKR